MNTYTDADLASCISEISPVLGAKMVQILQVAAMLPEGSRIERIMAAAQIVGGLFSLFKKTIIIADWVLNSPSYEIEIPLTEHGISTPSVVQAWENVGGGVFDLVAVATSIDPASTVKVSVTEVPDARFNGFITII